MGSGDLNQSHETPMDSCNSISKWPQQQEPSPANHDLSPLASALFLWSQPWRNYSLFYRSWVLYWWHQWAQNMHLNHSPTYCKQQIAAKWFMSPKAKETRYMCLVKVIEYKVDTQTIQCHSLLLNFSFKQAKVPIAWKTSNVTPIFKSRISPGFKLPPNPPTSVVSSSPGKTCSQSSHTFPS